MYFETKEKALLMQNHAFVLQKSYRLDPIATVVVSDPSHQCMTRVLECHYGSEVSPDRKLWEKRPFHKSASEYTASSDTSYTVITDSQTIELESFVDWRKVKLKYEACHINAKMKRKMPSGDAPSNILPLPSDWHSYFDGRTVHNEQCIDIIPGDKDSEALEGHGGRIGVSLTIKFTDDVIEERLAPQLLNARHDAEGYHVKVYKLEPDDFIARLKERHLAEFAASGEV